MIFLKNLEISNIGRFVGTHTVDIDSLDNLFQVDGINKNTGGSSGSAKTTLFNALDYLLGVNDLPNTVLQSRLTKDSIAVRGIFQKNNEIYTIKRSKSAGLEITTPTDQISGSSKVSEEWLDAFLEIPRDLLRPTFHKRQKEGGFFLGKTPKEMYAFLAKCLRLESYTKKQEKIEVLRKGYESKIQTLKDKQSLLESAVKDSDIFKSSLVEPKKEADEAILPLVENNYRKQKDILELIKKEHYDALLSISKPIRPSGTADDPKIKELELEALAVTHRHSEKKRIIEIELSEAKAALKKSADSLSEAVLLKNKLPKLEEDIALIRTEISSIKESKCPTCDQAWAAGHQHPTFKSKVEKAKDLFVQKEKALAALSLMPELESQVAQATNRTEAVDQALKSHLSNLDLGDIKERISTLKDIASKSSLVINSKFAEDVDLYNKQVANIGQLFALKTKEQEDQVNFQYDIYIKTKTLIDMYVKEKQTYDRNLEVSAQQALKNQKDLLLTTEELSRNVKENNIAENSAQLLKSYVNQLFYETLTQIAAKATQSLSMIPNMETACLNFEIYKENKSGGIKEEITPVLSMDGEVGIPVKSLSGGERASIDLAIDLAVIDMIEEKTGSGLNIFVLDEPFDGLDSVCKENCLSVLSNHDTNKKIGIVDHSNETKELVSSKIIVVRDGQESSIQ